MNRFLTIITLGIIATSGIIAATFEPYNRSRLFWDISSRVLTISNGGYGRVYELQNGRMVSVASTSSGYTMSFSDNKGKTWNDQKALFKARGNRHVANPEVFQMSDGTVLIGYNERPNAPYGADHPFLITLRRSTDNCETWSEPITIYTGDYVWENGCWEPIFLELPSGELQCYFSDETPFKTTSEQYIVMCRSFDGGFTWTKPIITSYRAGCRDGMPVPVITEAGEIVYTIEDFGHPAIPVSVPPPSVPPSRTTGPADTLTATVLAAKLLSRIRKSTPLLALTALTCAISPKPANMPWDGWATTATARD